jgi:gas vesicle protein
MIRLTNRRESRPAKRAREEATAAWDHLKAAAEHGARRVGDKSRRTSGVARERAHKSALAVRGEAPRSTTRKWLGMGLALGAAIGAAGAAVLGRRRNHGDETTQELRGKANNAMETVREKATEAAHRAATTARDGAAKLSEATKRRPHGNGQRSETSQMEPDPLR